MSTSPYESKLLQVLRGIQKGGIGRIIRNIIFWIIFTFYHGVPQENFLQNYVVLLLVLLVSYGIPGYINNLVLIPRYLIKRKYGYYLLYFTLLLSVTAVSSYYITHWVNNTFSTVNYMGSLKDVAIPYHVFPSMLVFILLAAGKFTADAINNQRKLETLETERLASELESLKTQVNPHFIFNALNTIYGLARRNNVLCADAVIKLSDILRYVLYDCDVEKIALGAEINFLNQYIEFARLRTRTNARIDFVVDAEASEEKIAPLLLLPLIENAIKHGLDKQIKDPWVSARLEVKDKKLVFNCANSNYNKSEMALNTSSGIGLKNVKRRLELIYPGHEIKVEETDSVYSMQLHLTLI